MPEQATLVTHNSRAMRRPAKDLRKTASRSAAGEPVDYGPFENWIGFHLRMAHEAFYQALGRIVRGFGVRPGRLAALVLIGRNPGISQTVLSRAISRDKSTLTPLLADLVRRGLVERTRTRRDRRAYRLKLSAAGEKALAALIRHAERHEQKVDRVIGKRDRPLFLRILRKISTELA